MEFEKCVICGEPATFIDTTLTGLIFYCEAHGTLKGLMRGIPEEPEAKCIARLQSKMAYRARLAAMRGWYIEYTETFHSYTKFALDWAGKPVEWIVCKACAKRMNQGAVRHLMGKGLRMRHFETF